MRFHLSVLALATLVARDVAAFGENCGVNYEKERANIHFPEELHKAPMRPKADMKIAYVGDVGIYASGQGVHRMINDFDPELTIHVGDYDYWNLPTTWMNQIDSLLGSDRRYIANIGNHELLRWGGGTGYQSLFRERHASTNMTNFCFGDDLGVMEACLYEGILIMLVGAGTRGSGHAQFIDDVFTEYPAQYKVCTWHKNQRLMQIAYKSDEVGWDVYETCLAHGAMIVNGHSHTYSRTHAMSSFEHQTIVDTRQGSSFDNPLVLEPGQSFLFVTGLGGIGYYGAEADRHLNPWWAAVTTNNIDPNSDHGATLCTYNIDGSDVSYCKQVGRSSGYVFDEFYFTSHLDDKFASTKTPAEMLERSRKMAITTRHESQIGGDISRHAFYARDACLSQTAEHSTFTVGEGNDVVLQFPDMKLASDVTLAQLQVYSASIDEKGLPPHPLTVGVRVVDRDELVSEKCARATSRTEIPESATFSWTIDDYEAQEVWVSPDFSEVVDALVAQTADPANLVLEVVISSSSDYEFFGVEKCLAPTLAMEYKN